MVIRVIATLAGAYFIIPLYAENQISLCGQETEASVFNVGTVEQDDGDRARTIDLINYTFRMTGQTLNAIGLVLNIAGVVLIFFFGLPQPSHEEGVSIGLEDGTVLADGTSVAQLNAKTRRRRRVYTFFAYFALSLLLAGFVCQLIAAC